MAPPRLERMSGALVGRELECAAIDRLLEASARGESSSLVLRGEAGIGKTALLTQAAEHAAARLPRRGAADLGHGAGGLRSPQLTLYRRPSFRA